MRESDSWPRVLCGPLRCGGGSFPNGNKGMSVSWTAPQQYGAQCSISCTVDEEANDGHPTVTLPDTGRRDDPAKAATGLSVTVGIHTFAVTQPEEGAHVCYDGTYGVADIECRASVDPSCYEGEIQWSCDTVSGTLMGWLGGQTGPTATLRLVGLPANNSMTRNNGARGATRRT